MNVLQPAMLWLLAAVAIPVVIHLYNRKRAVKRRFPALEFLLASNRKLARRLKIRQLLLLALRIGVFAMLPLAIARPYILSERGTTADEKLPAAVVIVLDDSASMQQRTGGTRAWDVASDAVASRLAALRAYDEAALILASRPDEPFPGGTTLTDDPRPLRDALEAATPTEAHVDLRRALEVARDLALSSELPVRRVVLVTDRGRGSFPDPLGEDLFKGSATVELVDVLSPHDAQPNLAVVDASFARDPAGAADTWEIRGTIQGFGLSAPRETEVELLVDGQVVASTAVNLAADGAPVPVTFTHRIESAAQGAGSDQVARVTLRLADGGSLPLDDERHLVIAAAREVRVLLVNGDPRAIAQQDELFFLERALRPGPRSRSTLVPRIATPEAMLPSDIEAADVVVLANVASLGAGQIAALEKFVRGGGGLLITVGERVDPTVYNRIFAELLPKPLRTIKRLADPDDPDAAIKVTRLDRADFTHAVMRPFSLPGGESLQQVAASSYMLLEPDSRTEARIVASFADGAPAMVERTVGAGRVMILTTSVDRDWSNLPLSKTFVPLMQRLTGYLARRAGSDEGGSALVGTPHRLRLDGYQPQQVAVRRADRPDGVAAFVLGATELELASTPSVTVTSTGHYRVEVTEQNVSFRDPALAFAANLDPRESDTTPLAAEALAALWQAPPGDAPEGSGDAFSAGANERRVELWPPLLMLVLILLYLETLVGLRRSFLRKLRGVFGRGEQAPAAGGQAPGV